MKDYILKFGAVFALFFAVVGALGAFGYLWAYNYKVEGASGDTVVAMIGVVVLCVMAWPSAVKLWKMINDDCKL